MTRPKNIANALFFAQVEAEITAGHAVEILVKGDSMRPLLRSDRDRVVLAPAEINRLAVGDIVLFRYRGIHILHRIVSIQKPAIPAPTKHLFTLAGDGNYRTTEQCTSDDIIAVVTAIVRSSGRIVSARSLGWRIQSNLWQIFPQSIRHLLLRALWRLGYR